MITLTEECSVSSSPFGADHYSMVRKVVSAVMAHFRFNLLITSKIRRFRALCCFPPSGLRPRGSVLGMEASDQSRSSVIEDATIIRRAQKTPVTVVGNVRILELQSNETQIRVLGGGGGDGFSVS